MLRLRELLGPEAVLTDGDTPRLHPDVRVDLLDALAHARAADEACAHQQLSRAYSSALALFATLDGRVPFAGLYDPIFELAREQVEAIARGCALRAGGALAAAGDFTGAATLLARAVASLPGDDELAERLAAALDAASRPLEAQRVRSAALR